MEKTAPPKSGNQPVRMTPAMARRAQKNDRKEAAREAARKAAAARRLRQSLVGAGVAVIVIAVVVFLIIGLNSGSSSAKPAASPSAASTAFPQLPPGADPALKTKPVVSAGSGAITKLTSKTLVKGAGAAVQKGDTVNVNYVGVSYSDGKEFDSSWSQSQPFSFTVGAGSVIKGWDQGLVGVTVGSRIQLDIPQSLAYPDGNGPSGTLRFVIDVLSAGPSASAAPSTAPSS